MKNFLKKTILLFFTINCRNETDVKVKNFINSNITNINQKKNFNLEIKVLSQKEGVYINKNFNNGKGSINDLFEECIKIINYNKKNNTGNIFFELGKTFSFKIDNISVEYIGNNKIKGTKKILVPLSKTYDVKDYIGVYLILKDKFSINDNIEYFFTNSLEGGKKRTTIVFLNKERSVEEKDNIKNFFAILLDENMNPMYYILTIDGSCFMFLLNGYK